MARPRRASAASEISTVPEQNQELSHMYDYLAKVILLGPSGSGKSCLLHRFVKDEWRVLSSQTIGVEFSSRIVKIGTGASRKRIKLQLWDTAGTERFRSVSRSYYRGAAGAILVYDIASLSSFNALPTFLMDARALASPNLSIILAGNKADLADPKPSTLHDTTAIPSSASSRQSTIPFDMAGSMRSSKDAFPTSSRWRATTAEGREVTTDIASRWASRSGIPVTMEVSALSADNVEEMFNRLARMILTKIELGEIDPDDPANGIQYGDVSGSYDDSSVRSGLTLDDGSVRRRKKGKGLRGIGEWEQVFRNPSTGRKSRGCC